MIVSCISSSNGMTTAIHAIGGCVRHLCTQATMPSRGSVCKVKNSTTTACVDSSVATHSLDQPQKTPIDLPPQERLRETMSRLGLENIDKAELQQLMSQAYTQLVLASPPSTLTARRRLSGRQWHQVRCFQTRPRPSERSQGDSLIGLLSNRDTLVTKLMESMKIGGTTREAAKARRTAVNRRRSGAGIGGGDDVGNLGGIGDGADLVGGDKVSVTVPPASESQLREAYQRGMDAGVVVAAAAERRPRGVRWRRVAAVGVIVLLIAAYRRQLPSSLGDIVKGGFDKVTEQAEQVSVTFNDVRGCDEAKQELIEVVDFLKRPERFCDVGARLPKGVLLVGPPGVGKTMLAKAVAGEAKVPFFHVSGSRFDEMFVGTGAARVRQLFESAKQCAPCVIFIDEIDSVGGQRITSTMHPYANQTINQLLAEMDGFKSNEGIIVLGATNRVQALDSALLRPGRFDVHVHLRTPDWQGRKDILRLYADKIRVARDVDLEQLAGSTVGFTGADLHNLVNQAAIMGALQGHTKITQNDFNRALDKIVMGPARKRLPNKEDCRITAYHEAGHALVALLTPAAIPLDKVTIIPRGQSLGHTSMRPAEDQYHQARAQLLAQLDVCVAGRIAEEIILGHDSVTTGASSDLQKASQIAEAMVKEWGMTEAVGLRYIPGEADSTNVDALLGRGGGRKTLSADLQKAVDDEINRLLKESSDRVRHLLTQNKKKLHALAQALLKKETLEKKAVVELLKNV